MLPKNGVLNHISCKVKFMGLLLESVWALFCVVNCSAKMINMLANAHGMTKMHSSFFPWLLLTFPSRPCTQMHDCDHFLLTILDDSSRVSRYKGVTGTCYWFRDNDSDMINCLCFSVIITAMWIYDHRWAK